MRVLFEAIREYQAISAAAKEHNKSHEPTPNCDFCKYPSIEARFRLMEAEYHDDINEVYKRLAKLEAKCLNL